MRCIWWEGQDRHVTSYPLFYLHHAPFLPRLSRLAPTIPHSPCRLLPAFVPPSFSLPRLSFLVPYSPILILTIRVSGNQSMVRARARLLAQRTPPALRGHTRGAGLRSRASARYYMRLQMLPPSTALPSHPSNPATLSFRCVCRSFPALSLFFPPPFVVFRRPATPVWKAPGSLASSCASSVEVVGSTALWHF